MEQSADRLCELVNAAGGRALVLCTSHANVERFSEVLRRRTDHHVLTQGDRDSGRLTKEFVEDETSVLVGTRSFWAGIDAAGVSCVLVVIDKIPFPVPDEPLHAARRERAQQRGVDAFEAVDLPAAALVLAQGAGRLIRTRDGSGRRRGSGSPLGEAVVPRAQLLAAMPPLRRSIDLVETCAFLHEVAGNVAAPAVESPAIDPHELRTDLSGEEAITIRNFFPCGVCDAKVTERCRDDGGTSGFLHEARVRAATG